MTYKTGTLSEFKAWTQRIVRDPSQAETLPKQWFDTDATAQQRSGITAEAMVKLLSPENLTLLQTIGRDQPASVNELAELTGRNPSNLSRTLKRLEQAGIVRMALGSGKTRRPLLLVQKVRMEIDLMGQLDTVTVEPNPAG
ncbi:MAG: MarR family transcriptional regulator [Methylococcus sp.]|nr:MAG: MarR family transcriptional regulator [Methylococcus sp.]